MACIQLTSVTFRRIDHVQQALAGDEAANVLFEQDYEVRALITESGDVRRDDDVIRPPQFVPGRQRLV